MGSAPEGGAVGAELHEAEPAGKSGGAGVRDGRDGLHVLDLGEGSGRELTFSPRTGSMHAGAWLAHVGWVHVG